MYPAIAITSSTDRGGIALALSEEKRSVSSKSWLSFQLHSDIMVKKISELLSKKHFQPKDIKTILLDVGPGSFTGIRLACNVAKTLAYCSGAKVFTLTSLEIQARQMHPKVKGNLISVLDAHRDLYYFQKFDSQDSLLSSEMSVPIASPIGEILSSIQKSSTFVGFLKPAEVELIKKFGHNYLATFPSAAALFDSALSNLIPMDWTKVEPLYIRVPDVVERSRVTPQVNH